MEEPARGSKWVHQKHNILAISDSYGFRSSSSIPWARKGVIIDPCYN